MSRRTRWFLVVVIGIMLLLAGLPAPARAGYRESFPYENTPSPWGTVVTTRYIEGFWMLRIYAKRKTPGTNGVISFQYKEASDPSFTEFTTYTITTDYYYIHRCYIVASGSLPAVAMWKIIVSGTSPGGISYWWYDVCDINGDPSYEWDREEYVKARWDMYSSSVATDTLTSGNLWILDRRFTYGEATSAIVMTALTILSGLALALRMVSSR